MSNFLIDPFNIFHTKLLSEQFQMNERFMKIEFPQENHTKYDAYLFGSSRIGTTAPSVIEKHIPNSHFYNLSVSAANMEDYRSHLKYFIEKGYPINTLYLQIDFVDTLIDYGHPIDRHLTKKHPDITGDSLTGYYLSYLTLFAPFNLRGKLNRNFDDENPKYLLEKRLYDLEETGTWARLNKESALQSDPDTYIKSVKSFQSPEPKNSYSKHLRKYPQIIAAFKDINQLCRSNKIELIVFTTPHNRNMMHGVNIVDAMAFVKDLAKIHDIWYFSGYNSITLDDRNYYESSHYRPHIGSLIAQRIFRGKTKDVPEDFGLLLTSDNIDTFIMTESTRLNNGY
ncbi:MAG: hypothetical protein WBF77_11440 [Sulfurimonadaceae bacterium]